jgi:hypothetical protein
MTLAVAIIVGLLGLVATAIASFFASAWLPLIWKAA